MLTCSIPRLTAERIARLARACANDNISLAHIGIRITATAVRCSATNGRILASLIVPVDDVVGTPADLILDRDQCVAALRSAAKGTGGRTRIQIDDAEARFTTGTAVAVVRRVAGAFPGIDHVWTRPRGRRWVPTMSSLDPLLLGLAQRIAGIKQPLLFASPVDPTPHLERLWASPPATDQSSMPVAELRAAITAPAYWADHEMAILIMPITRGSAERQLDLARFACPASATAAAA